VGATRGAKVQVGDGEIASATVQLERDQMSVTLDGLRRDYDGRGRPAFVDRRRARTWQLREARSKRFTARRRTARRGGQPMPAA